MNIRTRIARLERVLAPQNEPGHPLLLTRDQFAIYAALALKRARTRSRTSKPPKGSTFWDGLAQEERDKLRSFLNLQIERANAIEAAGRLPEVLASLRAKGVDVNS